MSRHHARLDVSWTGEATVADLGSLVDELPMREPTVLRPDGVLKVGDNRLRWAPLPPSRLRTRRARDGRVDFDRAFSPAPTVPGARITLPRNETPQRNMAVALLSSLLPPPISVAMAFLLKSPYFLLFGILSPIAFFATQWVEGRQRRKKEREFEERKRETLERIRRHSPDGLTLRVGVAGEPATIQFDGERFTGPPGRAYLCTSRHLDLVQLTSA